MGAKSIWEISAPSSQFYGKPKTNLKNQAFLLKKSSVEILEYKSLIRYTLPKYFLPVSSFLFLIFLFSYVGFWRENIYNFDKVQFIIFYVLCFLLFSVFVILENLCLIPRLQGFSSVFWYRPHRAKIKMSHGNVSFYRLWRRIHFPAHSGCWENWVPCDGKREVPVPFPAIRWGLIPAFRDHPPSSLPPAFPHLHNQ